MFLSQRKGMLSCPSHKHISVFLVMISAWTEYQLYTRHQGRAKDMKTMYINYLFSQVKMWEYWHSFVFLNFTDIKKMKYLKIYLLTVTTAAFPGMCCMSRKQWGSKWHVNDMVLASLQGSIKALKAKSRSSLQILPTPQKQQFRIIFKQLTFLIGKIFKFLLVMNNFN